MSKKLSLSLINSSIIIIFLILVTFAIVVLGFFSTKKAIDYNINQYFEQDLQV